MIPCPSQGGAEGAVLPLLNITISRHRPMAAMPIFKRSGKLPHTAADLLFQFSRAVLRRRRSAFLVRLASLGLRLPLTPTGGGRLRPSSQGLHWR